MQEESLKKTLLSKGAIAWYIYDFANSLLIINGSLYFTQWIVLDNGVPDHWLSITLAIATVLLFLTAPYMGVLLDSSKSRYKFILYLTLGTVACGMLIQILGNIIPTFFFRIFTTLFLYLLLNLFYQLSLFVYNTYLKDVSSERYQGSVSGIGFGIGTLGSITGLLFSLPFINGYIPGFEGRIDMFIPAGIIFLIVAYPMLKWAKNHNDNVEIDLNTKNTKPSYIDSYKGIWNDVKLTKKFPGVTRLLVSFYFFSDAQLTIFLFAAIYLDKVLAVPDGTKVFIFIIVLLAMSIGAFSGGPLSDKFGARKIYILSLFLDTIAVIFVALIPNMTFYYILFGLYGFSAGSAYAVSRAYLSSLTPYDKKGQFFSLYSLFERFASILGPLVWGLIILLVTSENALNYRIAVSTMGVFILISALLAIGMPKTQQYKIH